jgi:hypothetical protein
MPSKTGGTNTTKDVIYIDIDDEITGIIDKVRGSQKKIVALVLPKRAVVFQSVVNMKLLKRAASEAKKNLVLITSEAGLMSLAGSVGLHVAKSLSSKPEVPDTPHEAPDSAEADEETAELSDADVDKHKTVGELSGSGTPDDSDDEGPIELDNDDQPDEEPHEGKSKKAKEKKKFKIPNFNKFRVMLALAVVGVLLLSMLGYAALAVWPKATITISTDSQAVNSSIVLTLKTGQDAELDAEEAVLPAEAQEVNKTLEQEAPATGQKNNGKKATGSVVMSVQRCAPNLDQQPSDVPSGSGVSTGGKTYITQERASFTNFKLTSGNCGEYSTGQIDIVAQSGGGDYNVNSADFAVAGRSDIGATGSAKGGTDDIVKIVTQSDIENAKQKITEQDTQAVQQELKSALIGRNLFAVEATFSPGEPETKLSVEANQPADSVKVTLTINHKMLGVNQEDLEKIIEKDVESEIDTEKQSILEYGIDKAFFSLHGVNEDGASVSIQATVIAGAELDPESIKQEVAGKKAGDAQQIISARPGVTDVEVEYNPFYVSSIPKKTDKITVVIEEPKVTSDDAESP